MNNKLVALGVLGIIVLGAMGIYMVDSSAKKTPLGVENSAVFSTTLTSDQGIME